MAPYLDGRTREYVHDHGWRYDSDTGMITITEDQYRKAGYTGESLRYPGVRTIQIPTDNGSALYYEGMHFVITPA